MKSPGGSCHTPWGTQRDWDRGSGKPIGLWLCEVRCRKPQYFGVYYGSCRLFYVGDYGRYPRLFFLKWGRYIFSFLFSLNSRDGMWRVGDHSLSCMWQTCSYVNKRFTQLPTKYFLEPLFAVKMPKLDINKNSARVWITLDIGIKRKYNDSPNVPVLVTAMAPTRHRGFSHVHLSKYIFSFLLRNIYILIYTGITFSFALEP